MSYYSALGLESEPFSTSPDPAFFFLSRIHRAALCRLQVTIALKRGMSVILGDVGTGKTTLSRKLAQLLNEDKSVFFQMILNPYFRSERQFLARLADLFHLEVSPRASTLDLIEAVERFLFRKGVEEGATVVLLIDEAQILPDFVLETLRMLLNYETNEHKILQLVLVGQLELLPRIRRMDNFWDRIALKCLLRPLGEDDVQELLTFRLARAGYRGKAPLFTDQAVHALWEHTRGYPRKLALLCHQCLEAVVMYERVGVDAALVRRVIENEEDPFRAVPANDERGPDNSGSTHLHVLPYNLGEVGSEEGISERWA